MGMAKYDRLLFLLNLLRARRNLNAARLAEECGVTERSIYRDIIALSEANVPIYYDNGYKLATDNFLPPLNFDFEEYTCLKLALESSPLNKTGKYTNVLKSVRAKIEAGLSQVIRDKKRTAVDATHIDIAVAQEQKKAERFYPGIEEAVTSHRRLEIQYHSINSGLSRRVVEPYFIVFRGHAFYFVAYCRSRKECRTFRIDRVESINALDEYFTPKGTISARKYFEGSWQVYSGDLVEVVVLFTGTAARVISSSTHHPDEILNVLKNGDVTYRVTVRGTEEIQRWILGFGQEAVVVSPMKLANKLASIAKAMKENYSERRK